MYRVENTKKNKDVITEAIKEAKKINPHWVSFLHGAIKESQNEGTSVSQIVKREFKGLRREVYVSQKEEEDTAKFIVAYASTHFDLELSL